MVQDFAKLRASKAAAKAPPPPPANRGLLFTGLLTGLALGVFGSFLVYLSGVLPPLAQPTANATSVDADALARENAEAQQRLAEDLERAAAQLQLEFYQELPNYEVIVNTAPSQVVAARPPQLTERITPPGSSQDAAVDSQTGFQQDAAPLSPLTSAASALESAQGSNPDEALARTIAELTGQAPAPVASEPVRSSGLSYMIQAGAFQQEPAAALQSNRLIGLGLDARVKKEALLGKTLFLVQAGPYQTRDQLSQAERILRSNNIDSMRITLGER